MNIPMFNIARIIKVKIKVISQQFFLSVICIFCLDLFTIFQQNPKFAVTKYIVMDALNTRYSYVYRGYIMGWFVYDFYPRVRMWYLPRVSTANEWQISYQDEWIKTYTITPIVIITFLLQGWFLERSYLNGKYCTLVYFLAHSLWFYKYKTKLRWKLFSGWFS